MRRFILVGGSGFVGQYVLKELARTYPDEERYVLDLVKPKQGFGAKFHFCDLTQKIDFSFLPQDIVIHLAARQYHPKPPRNGREAYFFELNLQGTKRLIDKMSEAHCKTMIYFSTDMVYGLPQELPLRRSHPKCPFGPYGRSKLASEEFLNELWDEGYRISIFRPRMIVGRGRFGLLEKLFWLIKHNLPVPMIGSGKNCYQMVSVEDCANAVVCAIKSGIPNASLNLGSKNPPPIRELLLELIKEVGSRSVVFPTWGLGLKWILQFMGSLGVELMFEEQFRIADLEYIVDISETFEIISWEPRYSDQEMLMQAYEEYML